MKTMNFRPSKMDGLSFGISRGEVNIIPVILKVNKIIKKK